jgi:hypothetical protein
MASEQVEIIMSKVQQLPPEEQLELIGRIAEGLAEIKRSDKEPGEMRYLVYGEYRDTSGHESAEEDFKLAEWRPTEEWIDGH